MEAIKEKTNLGPVPRDKKGLLRLLHANGYILKRHGIHDIYEDERGHRVHVSQGDFQHPQLIKKIYLSIERGWNRVNNTEEPVRPPIRHVVFDEPQKAEPTKLYNNVYAKDFSNQPTLVIEEPEEKPVVKEVLSEKHWPDIHRFLSNGMTHEKIAEKLNEMNVTGTAGGLIRQPMLSKWIRQRLAGGVSTSTPVARAVKPKASKNDKFIHDLQDIITSNLSDELKKKFILARVQEEMS